MTSCELFLLRIVCDMIQNPEERKELHPDIISAIEEYFPDSMEFRNVILYYFDQGDILGLYQCLLMAELLINCDETGRLKL